MDSQTVGALQRGRCDGASVGHVLGRHAPGRVKQAVVVARAMLEMPGLASPTILDVLPPEGLHDCDMFDGRFAVTGALATATGTADRQLGMSVQEFLRSTIDTRRDIAQR